MPRGIPRDKSFQRKVSHKLKIAHGHLGKVIKMLEGGEYCVDVIHQSLAVQAALKKIDQEILANHLRTCVADSIHQGKSEEAISEVIKVMEKK